MITRSKDQKIFESLICNRAIGYILKGFNFEEGATARERNRQIGGHMSNIENNLKPVPSQAKLDKLAQLFMLDKADTELMWDLAAKSRKQRVSVDLPEYIMDRDIIRMALRTAIECEATDADWQEFIDKLNKQSKTGDE